ncbi:MAG: ATP-binding protein [Candidatus Nealsonbacteria bacterium]|nr:MAG: ATP-binding protein [Candidatus Nealsonbacteria bacterium]
MKLVIASGKGGVGKSMLASSLAILFTESKKIVAVDCDVDAPNLAIWLNEIKDSREKIPVVTSAKPIIDYKKCNGCGLCVEKCRFGAIKMVDGKPKLNPFLCEGCGVCEIVCPQKAIKLKPVQNGEIIIKNTKYGFPLIIGNLLPGETGSGKIITELKKQADKSGCKLQILDSSPGTGCPVIAALQDSNFAILITEPTPSAFSDLKRVLKVVNHFNIPWGLVINKWNIDPGLSNKIEKWTLRHGSGQIGKRILGKISYDKKIFKAVSNLKPIVETNLKAKTEIKKIFKKLNNVICQDQ